ncbi:MAG: VOC family protein [Candidatus Nanopelagicales bacterium]|nr:VOC family protein [Candidatus Nanopelagicales bacterium]
MGNDTGLEWETLILGIDHVGIAVSDLDTGRNLFEGILGLRQHHAEINETQGVSESMIAFPDQGAEIQLLAPLGPDTAIGKFLATRGPGIQQLALRVSDVELVADQIRAQGIRMLYDTARVGTAGSLVNFAHPADCGGVLIEFVQHG